MKLANVIRTGRVICILRVISKHIPQTDNNLPTQNYEANPTTSASLKFPNYPDIGGSNNFMNPLYPDFAAKQ
jgi:hypothetical protein